MSFKSKIEWPEPWLKLPTRNGDAQGHSTESRMLRKTPADGIRTQMQNNPDGSVTMLRTRNGWPEFTTIRVAVEKAVDLARGFVAHVVAATKSALFSPYNLSVENGKYTLHEHTYSVLPFASNYNVPVGDTTLWNDTLSLRSGKVFINAKAMPDLGMPASIGNGVPHLVPESGTGIDKYGASETNATVKRVFAVDRYRVQSSHSTAVTHDLGGSTYRAEGKALLHGARIEPSTHTAHLSQTVFTGSSWDSLLSSWAVHVAHVSMLLTSPFVSGANTSFSAEGVSPMPSLISSTPVSQQASYSPGDAPVCAYGYLYEWTRDVHPIGVPTLIKFQSDLSEIYSQPPVAKETFRTTGGTTTIYGGTLSQSFDSASGTLSVSIAVSRSHSSLYEAVQAALSGATPAETYTTPAEKTTYLVVMDSGVSPYFNAETPPANAYGENNAFQSTGAPTRTFNTPSRNYTLDEHGVEASVVLSTFTGALMSVSAHITERAGMEAKLSPVVPTISQYTIRPQVWSELKAESWWSELSTAERNAIITQGSVNVVWLAGRIVGKPLYSGARLSAIGYKDSSASRNDYFATLAWETRDFILFDQDEQIYIYILGNCSGSQGSGSAVLTLDVQLVIDVRGAKQYVALGHYEYSQVELLPTVELGLGTSLDHLPAPKVRPMFAPMYQSQGDFHGAAYTTLAEEGAGATPACLLNFVFELGTYVSVGLTDPSDAVVTFIPCNLLEMLYAYVFSSKYGIDDFQRYPVDFTTRFDNLIATLFGVQHRVAYRDGALVDWIDTFGGAYETEQTTELYRT